LEEDTTHNIMDVGKPSYIAVSTTHRYPT